MENQTSSSTSNEINSESDPPSKKKSTRVKDSGDQSLDEAQNSNGKKTYDNISVENRQKFILKVIFEKSTIKQAARDMKIKLSTAKAILKTFKKEGRIGKKKKRNKMSKLKRIMMMRANEDTKRGDEVLNKEAAEAERKILGMEMLNQADPFYKKGFVTTGHMGFPTPQSPMMRNYIGAHQDWKNFFETQAMNNINVGPMNTSFSNFMINYYYFKNLFFNSMNPQQQHPHQHFQHFQQPQQQQQQHSRLNKINTNYYNTFSVPIYAQISPSHEFMMPFNIKNEIKEEYSDIPNEN